MLKYLFKKLPGIAVFAHGTVLWSTRKDERSAAVAALGSEVDDIIRCFYDIKVVLNYNDGVSGVGELIDYAQELMDIGHMQTGGGFVEDIHRRARAAA